MWPHLYRVKETWYKCHSMDLVDLENFRRPLSFTAPPLIFIVLSPCPVSPSSSQFLHLTPFLLSSPHSLISSLCFPRLGRARSVWPWARRPVARSDTAVRCEGPVGAKPHGSRAARRARSPADLGRHRGLAGAERRGSRVLQVCHWRAATCPSCLLACSCL
jgi:hypothetical protein